MAKARKPKHMLSLVCEKKGISQGIVDNFRSWQLLCLWRQNLLHFGPQSLWGGDVCE